MTRVQLIAAIRSLLAAGLTVRDIAELLRAHTRARRSSNVSLAPSFAE
jgi:DNA-binding transcriptional MerR regulator